MRENQRHEPGGFRGEKSDVWMNTVIFLPTRTTRNDEQAKENSWGFSKDAQGFGRLDVMARAPASPAQGIHHHGPRYFNFPYFCTMCDLEKLGLVDQNWLERNLSALLLRTLVVGRR